LFFFNIPSLYSLHPEFTARKVTEKGHKDAIIFENPHFATPSTSDLRQPYSLTSTKNETSMKVGGISGVVK